MKKELLDILCCPVCKGDVKLMIKEEINNEIMKGELYCSKCSINYPIENGIPNMITNL